MFTGIIEATGCIKQVSESGSNYTFWIESSLSDTFTTDQSIAHDGVCLTVEKTQEGKHQVTAVAETLKKTALQQWKIGRLINLEQAMLPTKRLDGHFVQGHVDTVGRCEKIINKQGSHELTFSFPEKFASLIIEKGSVSLNGISLTVFDVDRKNFTVAVIPYTWQHTNLRFLNEDDVVNLEFDMVGKYIARMQELK